MSIHNRTPRSSWCKVTFQAVATGLFCLSLVGGPTCLAASVPLDKLTGVVVDDAKAKTVGEWRNSTSSGNWVAAGYRVHRGPDASMQFTIKPVKPGPHHVRLAYSAGGNRERATPVTVAVAGQTKSYKIDQTKKPSDGACFHDLGLFDIPAGQSVVITVSTKGTSEYVIADAVQLLTPAELKVALSKPLPFGSAPKPTATKKDPPKPPAPPPTFKRQAAKNAGQSLAADALDKLVASSLKLESSFNVIDDEAFLRRVTLDLIGRQPTPAELDAYRKDTSNTKRATAIDRLLASESFGTNWANYWRDVIAYRQQEPELTFHDYGPFNKWLAERFNKNVGWDEVVFNMLTARGKIGQQPAATYIGFHQGNAHRLAGETSRIFMGVRIACAECHDDPFVEGLTQERFHGVAAFFARTNAKIAQLTSDNIEVLDKGKGEHRVPRGKVDLKPTTLDGQSIALGKNDLDRRVALASALVSGDNRQFAQAYVNRVWGRLIGRGMIEPIDDMGPGVEHSKVMPQVLDALADHLIASNFDTKSFMRLVMNTQVYQRDRTRATDHVALASPAVKKMNGDEVFASLVAALGLPNVTPERQKKTAAVRFPPPPKSTRDLVADAFSFDPSMADADVPRTMKQAMFLMNNPQVQARINASPGSDSLLARLLKSEANDGVIADHLYGVVLARTPSARERKIVQDYVTDIDQRTEAWEDVLWSLINSTEFTTRK